MCYGFGEECDCNNNGWLIPTSSMGYTIFSKVIDEGVQTWLIKLHTKLTNNQPFVKEVQF
jgi:hypothetical protein